MAEVEVAARGVIREIVLNAPQRRNSLTREMLDELAAAVSEVAADTEARAVVIRGEGKAFCAGADLGNLFGDPNRPVSVIRDELKSVYAAFLGIRELGIPTLAAVDGPAVGAGANIALACDVIVAGPRAAFGITFAEIGLHPGGGCTWFLVNALGRQRAAATILGGETIRAEEAAAMGLVARLAEDPVATAYELAEQYARRDPGLLRDMLAAIDLAGTATLEQVVELESWAQASAVTKPAFGEFRERFMARTRGQ